MTHNYDIIVFGAGIAGLFIANRLQRAGYNLIVIEKDHIGGTQTLASQGMIHGGQKYTLQGKVTGHASAISEMPARWEACFGGWGDVDLTGVKVLSDTQVMFPAGASLWSRMTVFAASKAVNGKTRKLKKEWRPDALQNRHNFSGAVYEMQEKVLETKSLAARLAENLKSRILKGTAQEMLPDGQVAVDGVKMQAQVIIFTAGTGNEDALKMMRVEKQQSQRRPLRQVMVKPMPHALYGHGITGKPKPRVTITSHPLNKDEYVWYLGGDLAEKGAGMTEEDALPFAKKEMQEMFPAINWGDKEWASWCGDRAEPFDATGQLPPGPCIQQRGRILIAWPTKMTFVPALSDRIFDWLAQSGLKASAKTPPPPLPQADMGTYPWEGASWRKV